MANKNHATTDVDDEDESLQAQVAALQEQVAALLTMQKNGGGGLSEERLEKILLKVAETTAAAAERAANPSNKSHPGVSVFSYPEGDRERPRKLNCPMTWVGTEVGIDTSTAEEIELFNLAIPGVYQFKRTDGTPETLTVTGERDAGDRVTKLAFSFSLAKETRDTLPGVVAILRGAFRVPSPQERELADMKAQLEAMRQQLAVSA